MQMGQELSLEQKMNKIPWVLVEDCGRLMINWIQCHRKKCLDRMHKLQDIRKLSDNEIKSNTVWHCLGNVIKKIRSPFAGSYFNILFLLAESVSNVCSISGHVVIVTAMIEQTSITPVREVGAYAFKTMLSERKYKKRAINTQTKWV